MHDIAVTDVGRAVARSALLPRSAAYFFSYFQENLDELVHLLELLQLNGLNVLERRLAVDRLDEDLSYILFHLCYCSPEFGNFDTEARRYLPYPIGDRRDSERAERLQDYLVEKPWDRNMLAANAADISTDWILGRPLGELEDQFANLRGGMIRDMLRTASSHLSGLADILWAACSGRQGMEEKGGVTGLRACRRREVLRLVRRIYQYALQATSGLPEDILWMAGVADADGHMLILRALAMRLRERDVRRVEDLLDRGRTNVLLDAFGGSQSGRNQLERVRQAATRARLERTETCRERMGKRLPGCMELIDTFFESYGKEFEDCLANCFECLDFTIVDRDGEKNRPRFPDFVVQVDGDVTIVFECKSSPAGKDIDLGAASEVGAKAVPHGLAGHHLVTVCQKYVGTDVARQIETMANLSVINAEDLGLAMAYLKSEAVGMERFVSWLTTPGQPCAEEIFQR